jgi:hypothetical protein
VLLALQAWASSADVAAPCPPSRTIPVLPVVGDVDVPPDVRPVVALEGCGTTSAFELRDPDDLPVPFALEALSPFAQRIVPDEPLPPGEYRLVNGGYYYYTYGDEVWFTVGEGVEPPTPAEPVVTAEFDHSCEELTILQAAVALDFPDADPDQRGLLVVDTRVDGLAQGGAAPIAYTGQPSEELVATLPGGRQLCVTARLEDLRGDVAWETEELCGEPVTCPVDRGSEDGGCGCDGGHLGGVGGIALLAVAALGRRRARRR